MGSVGLDTRHSMFNPELRRSQLVPKLGPFFEAIPLTLCSHVWAVGAHLLQARVLQRGVRNFKFGKLVHSRFSIRNEEYQEAEHAHERGISLSMRKTNLARLLARRTDGIFVAPFEQGEIGPDLFRAACNMGLEGLVSKRQDRPYRAGRSPNWIKVKNRSHPAIDRVKEAFA
jgi:hypothetical protein